MIKLHIHIQVSVYRCNYVDSLLTDENEIKFCLWLLDACRIHRGVENKLSIECRYSRSKSKQTNRLGHVRNCLIIHFKHIRLFRCTSSLFLCTFDDFYFKFKCKVKKYQHKSVTVSVKVENESVKCISR